MPPDSRHAKVPGLRPRIFASPQTTDARWLPTPLSFIHASMVGSRTTAPLNRSNSVLIVAPHQDRRPQTRGASTALSSGSEPIFACTGLHSLKISFTSALLPRVSQKGRRFAGTLESAGVLSWYFESYSLVPGCHTFLILHGIAETFGLDAEVA